ncbi:hypothetical protein Xaut_2378 [Xanthobacter versatilis]|uniref:Uncharacterized protein n=1 Tax=Xanthobacter autotrophicus (strain ATCC BAA-1158 / Py2) TaxID=78245 RepID=A7IHX8_XANP2|nr:hypothetical protein Xaut_2378 [Xanthobacter autotrophicus Py2]
MALSLHRQMDAAAGSAPRGSQSGRSGLGVRMVVVGSVAVAGALFAAACVLWARHGATVFFDIMSAGIAACL